MASSSKEISEPYKKQLADIKSAPVYDKWWKRYEEYASGRGVPVDDVATFMNWLCKMKQNDEFAPTTIITAGSCVNSRMKLEYNKNFMDHMLVKDIIKKMQKESAPKQAAIFSAEQIDYFVLNAPETLDNKIKKIIALIAIQGALRISELTNLDYNDITLLDNGSMSIRIKSSKTDQAARGHNFIVTPNCKPELCCVTRIKEYLELFDEKEGRLFRSATKSGKLSKQPIGINTIGKLPGYIATFLKLPNIAEYTGHSFRRTSATILSEKGIGIVELKQHGRWRSSSVAERYVVNTNAKKMKTSNMIQNVNNAEDKSTCEESIFQNCSFVNCNFSIANN